MNTKTAMKAMYWFVALMWVGVAGYAGGLMVEKVQQSGGTTMHLAMAIAAGVICVLPALAVARSVARWIAGDSAAEQPPAKTTPRKSS